LQGQDRKHDFDLHYRKTDRKTENDAVVRLFGIQINALLIESCLEEEERYDSKTRTVAIECDGDRIVGVEPLVRPAEIPGQMQARFSSTPR